MEIMHWRLLKGSNDRKEWAIIEWLLSRIVSISHFCICLRLTYTVDTLLDTVSVCVGSNRVLCPRPRSPLFLFPLILKWEKQRLRFIAYKSNEVFFYASAFHPNEIWIQAEVQRLHSARALYCPIQCSHVIIARDGVAYFWRDDFSFDASFNINRLIFFLSLLMGFFLLLLSFSPVLL